MENPILADFSPPKHADVPSVRLGVFVWAKHISNGQYYSANEKQYVCYMPVYTSNKMLRWMC